MSANTVPFPLSAQTACRSQFQKADAMSEIPELGSPVWAVNGPYGNGWLRRPALPLSLSPSHAQDFRERHKVGVTSWWEVVEGEVSWVLDTDLVEVTTQGSSVLLKTPF
jgi:hypothetical protein